MRGLALGSQYAILGMGGLLNNLMGGAIIRANLVNGWRYNLYISAAVQLLGALVLLAFYRPLYLDVEEPSYFERVKARIDWIGNAIWMCAFIAIMFGLISGGSVYPWNSAPPIASLVVGFSLGVALAAHQIWYKKDGIFQCVGSTQRGNLSSPPPLATVCLRTATTRFPLWAYSSRAWSTLPLISGHRSRQVRNQLGHHGIGADGGR